MQSLLFVPATRPDRIAKAVASGADMVCIDLEDSVPEDGKTAARAAALAALSGQPSPKLMLRINGLGSRAGLADLLALAETNQPPALLMIPKVESAREIELVISVLRRPETGLIPLIETPQGLDAAQEIAAAAGVWGMMFGGGDLSAELGVALAWQPLLVARGQFLLACAAAGVMAIDVPYVRLDDRAGLEEETRFAKSLGFTAKAAIHPDQIETIHGVMRPTSGELEEARAALDAFASANGAAVRFRGKMLEEPMMRRYRRLLAMEIHDDA